MIRYLTHPQVKVDPNIPVPDWGLSDIGGARVEALAAAGWLAGTTRIVSSGERKAVETAGILAAPLGVEVEIRSAMHENDRSATGFLPGAEFEDMANRFFGAPEKSVRGWERAVDAQARIVAEVETALSSGDADDILFVGHGAVGTLLYCHIAGLPISRQYDQPAGGGNYFSFAFAPPNVHHHWSRMEDPPKSGSAHP